MHMHWGRKLNRDEESFVFRVSSEEKLREWVKVLGGVVKKVEEGAATGWEGLLVGIRGQLRMRGRDLEEDEDFDIGERSVYTTGITDTTVNASPQSDVV
ncbi:hypothetical protein HK102_009362, partial [Quaeritorhiza haematococci]